MSTMVWYQHVTKLYSRLHANQSTESTERLHKNTPLGGNFRIMKFSCVKASATSFLFLM